MSIQSTAADHRPVTWKPTVEQQQSSRLWDFMSWVAEHRHVRLNTYRKTWQWSVDDLSGFWDSVREYFNVVGEGFDGPALAEERMPGATWYPNAKLNFAENVLRHALNPELADSTAILTIQEDDSITELTWRQLESQVSSLAAHLRRLGIGPGDRVAAVLPNVPEAIIGLLATSAIGAVWTINSPDLSAAATLERLRQLEPKLLIGVDGYRFNAKDFDRLEHLADV